MSAKVGILVENVKEVCVGFDDKLLSCKPDLSYFYVITEVPSVLFFAGHPIFWRFVLLVLFFRYLSCFVVFFKILT